MTEYINFALPKGRLSKDLLSKMRDKGYDIEIDEKTRKLVIVDEKNMFRYLFVKPSDVITYVYEGVSDIGVVGKDSIIEEQKELYEILDLEIGKCKMVIAATDKNLLETKRTLKVATKYPNIAKTYFDSISRPIEIIKLNGSVELGPLVGLSDCIVDIYETGNTLKANGLIVVEEIMDLSARLITNKESYRRLNTRIKELQIKLG
jgi:ATP phosphoribosyltransferase